jgi:hypothetical protein
MRNMISQTVRETHRSDEYAAEADAHNAGAF